MRHVKITYGPTVSKAQFQLEQNCSLSFDSADGRPFIEGNGQGKPVEYLHDNEEFELLIGGYFIPVTLRREDFSHYYCTTEEDGHQGFRIEFPPRNASHIFLFARKKQAKDGMAKKEKAR
jgi:hypothetical protein